MDPYSDSTDRRPGDYLLFALAFIGFLIFVGGIILSSAATTVAGGLLLVLAIVSFQFRSAPDGS